MNRTTFRQLAKDQNMELAIIVARLHGVSLAQVQLWSMTK